VDKDERAKDIENQEEAKLLKDQNDEIKILKDSSYKRIKRLLHGKETTAKLVDDKGHVLLNKGQQVTDTLLDEIRRSTGRRSRSGAPRRRSPRSWRTSTSRRSW